MRAKYLLLFLLVIFSIKGNGQDTSSYDKWLPDYCSSPRNKAVRYVMLHYTSNALVNPANPLEVDKVIDIFKKYKVSSHYLIDRDGQLYRLVDEKRVAYHAGKGMLPADATTKDAMNGQSIGIELMAVGTAEEMALLGVKDYEVIPNYAKGFTEAQYHALQCLLEDIRQRHPLVRLNQKHIVGHDSYAPQRRGDPGKLFRWEKLCLPDQ